MCRVRGRRTESKTVGVKQQRKGRAPRRARPDLFRLRFREVCKPVNLLYIHSTGVDLIVRLAASPAKRRGMEGVMAPLPLDRARTLLCELSERIHACREYQVHVRPDETPEQKAREAEMVAFYERWVAVLEGRAA